MLAYSFVIKDDRYSFKSYFDIKSCFDDWFTLFTRFHDYKEKDSDTDDFKYFAFLLFKIYESYLQHLNSVKDYELEYEKDTFFLMCDYGKKAFDIFFKEVDNVCPSYKNFLLSIMSGNFIDAIRKLGNLQKSKFFRNPLFTEGLSNCFLLSEDFLSISPYQKSLLEDNRVKLPISLSSGFDSVIPIIVGKIQFEHENMLGNYSDKEMVLKKENVAQMHALLRFLTFCTKKNLEKVYFFNFFTNKINFEKYYNKCKDEDTIDFSYCFLEKQKGLQTIKQLSQNLTNMKKSLSLNGQQLKDSEEFFTVLKNSVERMEDLFIRKGEDAFYFTIWCSGFHETYTIPCNVKNVKRDIEKFNIASNKSSSNINKRFNIKDRVNNSKATSHAFLWIFPLFAVALVFLIKLSGLKKLKI